MKCEICNKGPMDGVSIHRVNEYGVAGIWRCEQHLTPEQAARLDPETIRIVKIIENHQKGQQ